jgi:hypothetical protein
VSGKDEHGNFEVLPPPAHTPAPDEFHAQHARISERVRASYGLGKIS